MNFKSVETENIFAIVGREELQAKPYKDEIEYDNIPELPKDLVFISIADPGEPFIQIDGHFKDILKLKFWDVEEKYGKYCPIHETQAKKIYDFILKNKDSRFLINCEAGISRSAGIGCAVEYLLRDKELYPKEQHLISKVRQHFRYDPNETVYKSIVSFEE